MFQKCSVIARSCSQTISVPAQGAVLASLRAAQTLPHGLFAGLSLAEFFGRKFASRSRSPSPVDRSSPVNEQVASQRWGYSRNERRCATDSEAKSHPNFIRVGLSWSVIRLLYPPSERSETGGYTVLTFECLCVSVYTQSSLQLGGYMHSLSAF